MKEITIKLKLDDKNMPYIEIDPPDGEVSRVELDGEHTFYIPTYGQETENV